jgi:disulfide bond formation protein DsbB
MINNLNKIERGALYWFMLIVLGVILESVALFFQYELEYWPCKLCIHVRIWVLAFTLLAIVALFVHRNKLLRTTLHVLTTFVMVALLERAWRLLGVERGTIEGSCNMESGLPGWFALDKWFPAVFKIHEPCGYTPELLFGVTMAEALLVLFAVLVLISGTLTLVSLLDMRDA